MPLSAPRPNRRSTALTRAASECSRDARVPLGANREARTSDLGARLDFAYVWLSRSAGDAELFEKVAMALGEDPPRAPASALERCRARARLLRTRAEESDDEDEL